MSQPDLVEQFAEAFVKEYYPPQPGDSATEKWESLQKWEKHYSHLYSREDIVSPTALYANECLPFMKELDAELTVEELSKAIYSLASGKTSGSDGIPPDLIKHCKTTLLQP